MKKLTSIIISLILLGSILSGCGKTSDTSAKKYSISTDATYAPFEYEKDGKYKGGSIEQWSGNTANC